MGYNVFFKIPISPDSDVTFHQLVQHHRTRVVTVVTVWLLWRREIHGETAGNFGISAKYLGLLLLDGSLDWFKGKSTGKPHIWWGKTLFLVDFPLNQLIEWYTLPI